MDSPVPAAKRNHGRVALIQLGFRVSSPYVGETANIREARDQFNAALFAEGRDSYDGQRNPQKTGTKKKVWIVPK
jgi:hypothetical protein